MTSADTSLSLLFPAKPIISADDDYEDYHHQANKHPPRSHKKPRALTAHLESVHGIIMRAINRRDFDPRSEAWQHFADFLHLETYIPNLSAATEYKGTMTREQYLQEQRQFVEEYPDFRMHCDT